MICRGSSDIIFPLGVLESLGGAQWSSVGALPLFLLLSLLETLSSFLFEVDPLVCLLVLHRSETPQLFTVLPEKRTATVGGAMMGSTHIYDMSTVSTWRTLPQGAGNVGRSSSFLASLWRRQCSDFFFRL